MTSRTPNANLSQMLLFFLIAWLIWFIVQLRSKYHLRPATTLPISRRSIENIVYRKNLFRQIPFFILIPLLFLLLCLVGRIGPGTAIASSLVVLIVPAWNIYVLLYLQWRPLRSTPNEFWTRLEREMSKEILQRMNGAWQFVNWNWCIRVSEYECTLLRAEIIDFEKAVCHHSIVMHSMGFKHSVTVRSHEYIFTGKDGSIIRARMEQTPRISNWVKNHGGRFE